MATESKRHLPAPSGTGSGLPQRQQAADPLTRVEETFRPEFQALAQSGLYDPYLSALDRLGLALGITIPEDRGLIIALRLHAHGCTAAEARVIADLLADDQHFVDGLLRFKAPLTAAPFITKLSELPRPGRRYGADEAEAWGRHGYPRERFVKASGDEHDPRPLVYVAPKPETAQPESTDEQA